MSLFFLHPLYLFGLITASVPVLIHLLNRRRLKRIRFPAVRFLLLSQRRISRTTRLRHWFLLALRTFAVLLLVLLLAHPIFQTGAGLFAGGGPLSLAVILDNSLSMRWSRGGDGFKQAKEAVARLISSFKAGDRAAVIAAAGLENGEIRLKGDKEALQRELDAVQIGAGRADFSAALNRAYQLLREPAARKEIWLVTDMALTDWERFSLSSVTQYDPLVPLRIVKIGQSGEAANAAIKEIRMRGDDVSVGLPIQLQAVVANFTEREIKELLVQLQIDDQAKEQKLVSLRPGGEAEVSFQFVLSQAGPHRGAVTLKKDRLAGNPISYFTLQAEDKLKVLVVDGDPKTSLVQSETFFLTRALNPGEGQDSSPFLLTVAVPEELGRVALDPYQVLILCNVPAIPDAIVPKLRDFLRRGGGLLLFLGDRVQADDYNLKLFQSSPPILPARLRDKRMIAEGEGEKVEKIDQAHPALAGFAEPILRDSLKSTKARAYFRVDGAGASVPIALANGDPLLLERRLGPARILLFTTAADRDWSDLPLKTAYLPLVQSLAAYLYGGKKGSFDGGVAVGSAKSFLLPPSYVGKSLKIAKPDRKEREVPIVPEKEKAAATFAENDLAGIYRLTLPAAADGAAPPPIYPANSPFSESRLDPIGEKELGSKLSPIPIEVMPIEALEKGGKRSDLSLPLLLVLIVTLLSEGWLAQRFYG
jgi:hypothetical protein